MGESISTYAMLLVVRRVSICLVDSKTIRIPNIRTTFISATKANVAAYLKPTLDLIFIEKLTKAREGHFAKGAKRSNRLLQTISFAAKLQVTSCRAYLLQQNNLIMSFVEITMYWTCPSLQGQAVQKWIRFDGGGTMFPKGANSYTDDEILQSLYVQLKEMTAFAQGRLAQDAHSQAGIAYDGGLVPLLKLLELKHGPLQHNAAFSLYELIVDTGALPHLNSRAINSVIRRAPDVITNLAHENNSSKTDVRIEGAIPPLVEFVQYVDSKVQRSAAGRLRTLAFKNDENKNQIVSCNAPPTLVLMLRSEDAAIHYEAVGVIGNLVHSSTNIKKQVLNAGALQPVIGLLSSCCTESQREAALLLGQFAATDLDCKVHIVQRGAAWSLIEIFQSPDVQLREMTAFALGRLAQDTHNQAGIAYDGGLMSLLKLLESEHGPLQHNAAFALYSLVDNEDNVSDFIKVRGVQKLQDGEFIVQATKDCVARTLKRLEEKIKGRVLNHLIYLMRVGENVVQRRVALAVAHLCSPCDKKTVFIDNKGLELLLGLLASSSTKQQKDAFVALFKLATKATLHSTMDAAPLSPTPQVYLGIQFVNNATLSGVTFLDEGKQFHAHRITLLASSEAFRAMFDGGYRERDARDIEIPNIRWEIFELMMRVSGYRIRCCTGSSQSCRSVSLGWTQASL